MKKKIFLISNLFPSENSPQFGVFVKNFKDQIQNSDELTISNLSVIRGRHSGYQKLKQYLFFVIKTIKLLKKSDYNIIYIHYGNHSLLPLLFIKPKTPYIVNLHGGDLIIESKFNKIIALLTRHILVKSYRIVVPSTYMQDKLLSELTYRREHVFISPSGGVNTSIFKFQEKVTKDITTIGFVSRFDLHKGWDTFLELANHYKKDSSIQFKMIGNGTYIEDVKKFINKNELNNIQLSNFQKHTELSKSFQTFDLFIFPSSRQGESLGLVGLESMACGTPVIGSNSAGIKTYIEDNYNGYLFNPESASDLISKTTKYLNLTFEEKQVFSQNAYLTSKKYDSLKVQQELNNFILSVL